MTLFSRDDLNAAAALVHEVVPPTPSFAWPLLARRIGATVVVKHENHTPTGAFKVRGGMVYMDSLSQAGRLPKGVVTATRGEHAQRGEGEQGPSAHTGCSARRAPRTARWSQESHGSGSPCTCRAKSRPTSTGLPG